VGEVTEVLGITLNGRGGETSGKVRRIDQLKADLLRCIGGAYIQ
jgi:hypothetical protein